MFPNHQGKFDTLGIMYSHERPCTVVMDEIRSRMPLADQMVDILDGCRLNKSDMRSQVKSIKTVSDEVKNGKIYIIFPEGGYYHNRNVVQEFLPGAFKAAMMAKAPIVPVAIVDSYRAFGVNILMKITTQVHYLKPLYYEDYKDMKSKEISDYVKLQIMLKINEAMVAKGKKAPNKIPE
jgi:1-acyl-sn-glycerol-3-phosphate acyltransferase